MPSSSSSRNETLASNDQHLLQFYRNKFEEFQRKEDKYKEKVDSHLKRLVTDRHELEEELLRRGEKISDLQKALVELQLSVFEERERFLRLSTENEDLKKNERQMHSDIRQLLATTHQQDLRDKIIYILKNPKLEIGLRTDFLTVSKSPIASSASNHLKEELDYLKHQLDEALQHSKSDANLVLEDCIQALEKSKAKIMQDEIEIRKLHKKLGDLQTQRKVTTKTSKGEPTSIAKNEPTVKIPFSNKSDSSARLLSYKKSEPTVRPLSHNENEPSVRLLSHNENEPSVRLLSHNENEPSIRLLSHNESEPSARLFSSNESESVRRVLSLHESKPIDTSSPNPFSNVCSHLKHMKLSLDFLSKVVSKVTSILNTIQATKLYQKLANIPKAPAFMEIHVEENTVTQLESSLRQCTRLTYEIGNNHKSLRDYVGNKKEIIDILRPELQHLKEMLQEMAAVTADNDLLNVGLRRSPFFEALRDSSVAIPEEDRLDYLDSFKTIVSNNTGLDQTVSRAAEFVESVIQKYSSARKNESQTFGSIPDPSFTTITKKSGAKSDSALLEKNKISAEKLKSQSLKDLENLLSIYKRTFQEAKDLGLDGSSEMRGITEKLKSTEKLLKEELKKSHERCTSETAKQSVSELKKSEERQSSMTSKQPIPEITISDQRWSSMTAKQPIPECKKSDERWSNKKAKQPISELMKSDERWSSMTSKQPIPELTKLGERQSRETTKPELKKCDDNFDEDIIKPDFPDDLKIPPTDHEEILRKINKTLSKIKLVEQGKCSRDEKVFKKLAENVNGLTRKFNELRGEFDVKSLRDQLSEYSRTTLSKLEELAKQSRNSVIAAESQIAAHRSNARYLSEKLKETEDLLRESVNECLTLKQKLKQTEEQHEVKKYNLISRVKESMEKISDPKEVESILDDLTSYIEVRKDTKVDPFLCFYCKQGLGHQLCQEKIRDLMAEERKSRTELKLLIQDTKQEKEKLMYHTEVAERTSADLVSKNEELKEAVRVSEKKNASLLEHLKLQKNRIKNMERYRRLEVEGFHTDIKNLKIKIQDLEKKLMKAVLIFENNSKDMELLKIVHDTAQRSKEATAALRRLKAKLYELENDIKGL